MTRLVSTPLANQSRHPERSEGLLYFARAPRLNSRAATIALALLFLLTPTAKAHVGSKDVFQTVIAGPYILYVTVRPPNVIPGVASVEVRSSGANLTSLHVTPLPVTGEASRHPPAADTMQASAADPAFYTGAVWMMASGAWQVRFDLDGASGHKQATVPVLAVPVSTLKMQKGMGLGLGLFGLFLVVSMAGIVAASVREARLPPGVPASPTLRRRGLIATAVSLAVMLAFLYLGDKWWNVEAASYSENIAAFAPAKSTVTLTGTVQPYDLQHGQPPRPREPTATAASTRRNADFLLRPRQSSSTSTPSAMPAMDAAFHLHPTLAAPGDFRETLPAMPPGHYQLFGDIVHRSGFPETLVATLDIPPGLASTPLDPEDASATPAPLASGELPPAYKLPDGYTMVWDRPAPLAAGAAYTFRFRLLDPTGKPAADMQPYLGMAGHAAFVKTDATVFAHTHPEGSAPMPDVELANASLDAAPAMTMTGPISPEVGFPYGFPTPGPYRIFIQMKHAGTVETGVFDAEVK